MGEKVKTAEDRNFCNVFLCCHALFCQQHQIAVHNRKACSEALAPVKSMAKVFADFSETMISFLDRYKNLSVFQFVDSQT